MCVYTGCLPLNLYVQTTECVYIYIQVVNVEPVRSCACISILIVCARSRGKVCCISSGKSVYATFLVECASLEGLSCGVGLIGWLVHQEFVRTLRMY